MLHALPVDEGFWEVLEPLLPATAAADRATTGQ